MPDLLYTYAVVPATAQIPAGLRGIGGQPLNGVVQDDLLAAVGEVPAEEFDEEPLNALVRDLEWLGPRAVAHQEVNARLFEGVEAIVPLSFGAVFRDEAGVRRMLLERGDVLRERLAALRGRGEWVVAVQRDRPLALKELERSSEAVRSLRAALASERPGRAYLLRRKIDEVQREELFALDAEVMADVAARLEPYAAAVFREPLASSGADVLLRASMLVSRDAESVFAGAADNARRNWGPRGYDVRATGPWPPYRFAGLDRDDA